MNIYIYLAKYLWSVFNHIHLSDMGWSKGGMVMEEESLARCRLGACHPYAST